LKQADEDNLSSISSIYQEIEEGKGGRNHVWPSFLKFRVELEGAKYAINLRLPQFNKVALFDCHVSAPPGYSQGQSTSR